MNRNPFWQSVGAQITLVGLPAAIIMAFQKEWPSALGCILAIPFGLFVIYIADRRAGRKAQAPQ